MAMLHIHAYPCRPPEDIELLISPGRRGRISRRVGSYSVSCFWSGCYFTSAPSISPAPRLWNVVLGIWMR
jgi:hypothetical protein